MSLEAEDHQLPTSENTEFTTPATSPTFVTTREDSRHRRTRSADRQPERQTRSRERHTSEDTRTRNVDTDLLADALGEEEEEEEYQDTILEPRDNSADEEEITMTTDRQRAIARLERQYDYRYSDDEDEQITQTTTEEEKLRILTGRKRRKKENDWQTAIQSLAIHQKEKEKPTFSGAKDKKPEAHILMVEDWRERKNIDVEEIVEKFKETLEGQARIWYQELDTEGLTWEKLQQEFIREYSKGGKSDFQIKLEQHTLRFDPNKDKIKDFIREYRSTAKILKWDEEETKAGLCETLPQETYYIASVLPTLKALIKFMTDTYSRKRNHTATVSDATVSPFMAMQAEGTPREDNERPQPRDKPFKPWITPSTPGRPSYSNMHRNSERRDYERREYDQEDRRSYRDDRRSSYSDDRRSYRDYEQRNYRDRYDRQPRSFRPRRDFQRRDNWRGNSWNRGGYRRGNWRRNDGWRRNGDWRRNDSYRSRDSYRSQSRGSRPSSYSRDRYRSMSTERYNPRTTKRFISPKPPKQSYRMTDTARQKSIDETRCYRCNEPGHFAKECPLNEPRGRGQSRDNRGSRNRSESRGSADYDRRPRNVSFRYGETQWDLNYQAITSEDSDQEN